MSSKALPLLRHTALKPWSWLLHGGITTGASRVAVVGPAADRPLLTDRLEAVLGVVGGGVEVLLGISAHQVVEHRIGLDLQAGGMAGGHGRQELRLVPYLVATLFC